MELFLGPKKGAVADPRVARLRMYLNNLAVFKDFSTICFAEYLPD